MTVYSAETNDYNHACELIKNLQVAGVESCLTAGAVAIQCTPDQVNQAQEICNHLNATFRSGYIGIQKDLLIKSDTGATLLEKSEGDARSIVDEWKK